MGHDAGMLATNTYGRRTTTARFVVVFGWVLLGLAYVTVREIGANLGAWIALPDRERRARRDWSPKEPLLFPPA
jgi:hypothetical protein